MVVGRTRSESSALVLGDVAIQVVIDQGFGVFVVDGGCTAGALPERGRFEPIGGIVGEVITLDVATSA